MQPGACNTKLSIHFRTATYEGTQYTTLQCSIRCLCSAKFNPLHGEYSFETRSKQFERYLHDVTGEHEDNNNIIILPITVSTDDVFV
ncbi:unnamed protein product [Macrosiphum euphorbiae]|uniref:Uncharacterized protein n=1 Tax=Macrosiphum euphorbiae TaxID=13131 RepID=A0AAV0VPP1_9HEMI|nr:unnamed protein product [Macrosiphum euphorbiae]